MKVRTPAGPILLVWILAAARAFHIQHEFRADSGEALLLNLMLNELKFALLFSAWMLAATEFRSFKLTRVLWNATGFAAILYAGIDTAVLFGLDRSVSLSEIAVFASELGAVSSFFTVKLAVAVAAAIALMFVWVRSNPWVNRGAIIASSIAGMILVNTVRLDGALAHHDWNIQASMLFLQHRENDRLAWYPLSAHSKYPAFKTPELSPALLKRKRVVLLMVEGLSHTDSLRSGGQHDMLAEFDKLSMRGTLFTNAFASEATSAGSYIGLMQGIPPLPYPGAKGRYFDDFTQYPSLVQQFNAAGYFTEYTQGAGLDFLGRRQHNETLGFRMSRGRDEIDRFKGKPTFVFHAPPDGLLYDEVLDRVKDRMSDPAPFFHVVFTISSHRPWQNPDDGAADEAAVWRYVQREMIRFVDGLTAMDFFSDGVLIITGDHRKMTEVTEEEWQKYNDVAAMRVALLIIGPGFTPGRIDSRVVPHYELLPKFAALESGSGKVADFAIFVPWRRNGITELARSSSFPVIVDGTRPDLFGVPKIVGPDIEWTPGTPLYLHKQALASVAIHSQRLYGQEHLQTDPECGMRYDPRSLYQNTAHLPGIRLVALSSPLEGLTEEEMRAAPKVLGSRETLQLNFEDVARLNKEGVREVEFQGYLKIEIPDEYQFRFAKAQTAERCLTIGSRRILNEDDEDSRWIMLKAGFHELRLHLAPARGELQWRKKGDAEFVPIPSELFEAPN